MFKALLILLSVAVAVAVASPLDETRYCGEPARTAKGDILRRADVLAAFKKIHPCPSTGKSTGACPGWNIDHVIPLANGGCDAVPNLQWLPIQIKRCPGEICKDRWERKVYLITPEFTPSITKTRVKSETTGAQKRQLKENSCLQSNQP